jgi:hypothetical protein
MQGVRNSTIITLCIPMKEGNCCFDLILVAIIVFMMRDIVIVEWTLATHCFFVCVVF